MIVDPRCIGDVLAQVDRGSFFHTEHQVLFDVIYRLYNRNRAEGIDGALVCDELNRAGQMEAVGGIDYLKEIISTVPSAINAGYYAKNVADMAAFRACIVGFGDLMRRAYDQIDDDPGKLLEEADSVLSRIRRRLDGESGQKLDFLGMLQEEIERIGERMSGKPDGTISTGMFALDAKLDGGFRPGELIVPAGRPGMGKTALADTIIESAALGANPIPIAFFSLEMGQSQISRRLLCLRSGIPVSHLRRGKVMPREFQEFLGIANDMGGKPVYIHDGGMYRSGVALRTEAYRLHREHGIKLMVIDYLGLMYWPGRTERRDIEIGNITGALKSLAKDIGVPVLLLCQLNRKSQDRTDMRPRLSDLRDSGNIEQDADVVILLHREDAYHRDEQDYQRTHLAEAVIAKQRDGDTGTVILHFDETTMKFSDPPQVGGDGFEGAKNE
jgi:replicative DNA helicase